MDRNLLDSSDHGILQARILEWVAIPFSRGSSWHRDQTWVFCIAGRFFTIWATREAPSPQEKWSCAKMPLDVYSWWGFNTCCCVNKIFPSSLRAESILEFLAPVLCLEWTVMLLLLRSGVNGPSPCTWAGLWHYGTSQTQSSQEMQCLWSFL